VLRGTLDVVPGSYLAELVSGRPDSDAVHDAEGHVFIDATPEVGDLESERDGPQHSAEFGSESRGPPANLLSA
jgi:hypothetical protein